MFITPAVAGETLYVGSCSGRFFAFDAATGTERWVYDTTADGPAAQFHGDMLIQGDQLVVGADVEPTGHLYAFDRTSGRVLWKLPSPGGVSTQVLAGEGLVYAQTTYGEVWAVDAATGRRVWTHAAVGPGAVGWRQVDPVLAGKRLIVAWPSGDVEALDVASGRLLWRVPLAQTPNTSLAVVGPHVLVGTMEGRLHRLSLADGAASPAIDLGGRLFGDLVAADRCLLVLAAVEGYSVTCLDATQGKSVWRRSFPAELDTFRPLLLGDVVVVGYRGRLVALALADGTDAWSCPIDGVPRGLNADEQRLYVGTLGGPVVALPLAECRRGVGR